jgi:hypothetical protein
VRVISVRKTKIQEILVVSTRYKLQNTILSGYPVEDYFKLFLLYCKNRFREPLSPESDSKESR